MSKEMFLIYIYIYIYIYEYENHLYMRVDCMWTKIKYVQEKMYLDACTSAKW